MHRGAAISRGYGPLAIASKRISSGAQSNVVECLEMRDASIGGPLRGHKVALRSSSSVPVLTVHTTGVDYPTKASAKGGRDMLRPGHCSEGKGKTGLRSMERASGGGGLR
jgi:hypothetical protein